MKKEYLKRIAGIALMLLTVGVYVWFMQSTVADMNQIETRTVRSFYMEDPDSLDVVVIGASEVANGYSAAEAYRHAGFTSFPMAFSINSVVLWKYELKDIERTQHPKVLVVETNGALYEEDKFVFSDYCRSILLEGMPMSLNRIKAAFALSDDPVERLIPFIKYHYKWPQIRKLENNTNWMLMQQGHSKLRGVLNYAYRDEIDLDTIYPQDGSEEPMNENAEKALAEFLEECKKSSIEHIVFIEYPHIVNEEKLYRRQQRANSARKMISDAGFDYIDLNSQTDEIGLDYTEDFFDTDHLMASGQRKISQYLADILKDRYLDSLKEQSDENRAEWDESADLIEKYYILSDRRLKKNPHGQLKETRSLLKALDKIKVKKK